MDIRFKCNYENDCLTRKNNPEKCSKCENNTRRNHLQDCFIEAKDDPIPDKHVDAAPYEGPAEQTAGYKCPICHGYTNPYQMTADKTCKWCGYKLFLN